MKKSNIFKRALVIVALLSTSVYAQDGEGLFKAKCGACHILGKDGTGPNLKGVKQKWTDAGEGDLLFEWVKNSTALIAGGKSTLANTVKGYSAMDMPAQDVTKEDVDAILTYVDGYVEAKPLSPDSKIAVDPEIKIVPNYESNLTLFYWLLASIVVLLIGILIMSSTILGLAKSDYFKRRLVAKQKEEDEDNNSSTIITSIIAIVGVFGLMALNNTSLALSFMSPGEATEKSPWLLVEDGDLIFLLVIDLVLVGVIFYLRSMFRNMMNMIKSKEELAAKVDTKPVAMKKINHVLTDVVPIEQEHKILMEHEYDGIRELDNNLPPWWVWMFYATILFSIIYLVHYEVLKTGDSQAKEYTKEMKAADAEVKAYLEANAMNVDETNVTLLTESADIAEGKAIFEANCVACHNPKGEGNIGPNLTDKNWIYGFDIKDVFKTIKNGTPNGMPEHNSKFNPVQIQKVSSFVLSLPETKGKVAEGTIIEK